MSLGQEVKSSFEAYLEGFCFFVEIMAFLINKFELDIFNRNLTRFKEKYIEYRRALGRLKFFVELLGECKENLPIRHQQQMPYVKQYNNWLQKRFIVLPPELEDMGKMSQKDEIVKITLYLLLKFLYRDVFFDNRGVYFKKERSSEIVFVRKS